MAKIDNALATKINNEAVIQAANNAAEYYEQTHKKTSSSGSSFIRPDIKNKMEVQFSSAGNNPYTALLKTIINYAKSAGNEGQAPVDLYSANAKDKVFSELPFPQYAVGIKDAAESGVTVWRYVPYELVYPANKGNGMSSDKKALKRASGSKQLLINTLYKRKFADYEQSMKNNLEFRPDTTGGMAAQKLNTVLESRKLVTPDFNMDNEGDKMAVDFVRLVNNRLPADEKFRKEFFKYAEEFKGSQFQKYLNYCGFDDNAITEYSSL